MNLEVTGKLIEKNDTIQVSEKFKKREFVLELAEEINGNVYTNFAKMQLVQNKCDLLDRYNVGDMLKVNFNIKGNSYVDKKSGETKYITNLDVWRIENAQQQAAPPQQQPPQGYASSSQPAPPAYTAPAAYETNDDLPF